MSRPIHALSFGLFELFPAERRLERDGKPVPLGGRAFDILVVLTDHAGEVVSTQDLIKRVWADINVDEGSLRAHLTALRKVLSLGQPGARYVANIPGRGYCFVAPIEHRAPSDTIGVPNPMAKSASYLPARPVRMVGRDDDVNHITEQLLAHRFVTIAGPGGIGKTTVAVAVGHALAENFEGAVRYIDLASLEDTTLVPGALATALGLPVHSDDLVPSIVHYLNDKRILLVFDNCEHLVDDVANLTEKITQTASAVHLLATSREALRVEGEHVHRLTPLKTPPSGQALPLEEILAYPAVQLFTERATAAGELFELEERHAPYIADICHRLDGIALAIELAAGQVNVYGIEGLAARLSDRFGLLWRGRHSAPHRHQTLNAALEWSYDLLSEVEKTVLRRMAVFAGNFTLEDAQEVAIYDDIGDYELAESVAALVEKSLISTDFSNRNTIYRLLDTTRTYMSAKKLSREEFAEISRRHALYYAGKMAKANAEHARMPSSANLVSATMQLSNIRIALEWSFSPQGDANIGVDLAWAAAPFLLEISLLTECQRWTDIAIASLPDSDRGSRQEMELQTSLGLSLMFLKSDSKAAKLALTRALKLAEALDDSYHQMRLFRIFSLYHTGNSQMRDDLAICLRAEVVASKMSDPAAVAQASSMLAARYFLIGDMRSAEKFRSRGLLYFPDSQRMNIVHFGFNNHILALCTSANILFYQGLSDQSLVLARQALEQAEALGHPATLCISLIWTIHIFRWAGDWQRVALNIDTLITVAEKYSLAPYSALGIGLRGQLLLERGNAHLGVSRLEDSIVRMESNPYQMLKGLIFTVLAEGLVVLGRADQALAAIESALQEINNAQGLFYEPETLRVKGDIIALMSGHDSPGAEDLLNRSYKLAESQCSLIWQLRTAISLAKLHRARGNPELAQHILTSTLQHFSEGLTAPELVRARSLLAEFAESPSI